MQWAWRLGCLKALIVFTQREVAELFGEGGLGTYAFDYAVRKKFIAREYLADNIWTFDPSGETRGSRYNIASKQKQSLSVARTWCFIREKSLEKPTKPDKILEQLVDAQFASATLLFFSPWGPPYERYKQGSSQIREADPEIATLRELNEIFSFFRREGYKLEFLLMPTDSYGTEINPLPQDFVREYYLEVEKVASAMLDKCSVLTMKTWSAIREERKSRYVELRRDAELNFSVYVKEGDFERAKKAAIVYRGDPRAYCIERVVEGKLIAEVYDPIKISLARRQKDVLDGPLKRLYIVQNRTPWLRGENDGR